MIQFKGRFGQRARRRLKTEKVIWLTTVGPDGTPQPRPVWFVWDEPKGSILIYSEPQGHKLRHLKHNPRVALHFNSDEEGGDVVVMTGQAAIDRAAPPVDRRPDYVRKYRSGIRDLGLTPASMGEGYSVPIRVRLEKLRGF